MLQQKEKEHKYKKKNKLIKQLYKQKRKIKKISGKGTKNTEKDYKIQNSK